MIHEFVCSILLRVTVILLSFSSICIHLWREGNHGKFIILHPVKKILESSRVRLLTLPLEKRDANQNGGSFNRVRRKRSKGSFRAKSERVCFARSWFSGTQERDRYSNWIRLWKEVRYSNEAPKTFPPWVGLFLISFRASTMEPTLWRESVNHHRWLCFWETVNIRKNSIRKSIMFE